MAKTRALWSDTARIPALLPIAMDKGLTIEWSKAQSEVVRGGDVGYYRTCRGSLIP